MRNRIFISIIILFCVVSARAIDPNYGFSPSFTVSYSPIENWQLTSKIEMIHVSPNNRLGELTTLNNYYDEIDYQIHLVRRINPFWKISIGYQHGFVNGGLNDHQMIQQISNVYKGAGFRLGHRFRGDQMFKTNSGAEFRLRYRLSIEKPLNGQTLDAGEMYFLASNEPMIRFTSEVERLENRLYVSAGKYFSNKQKFEMGIEHRLINNAPSNYLENVFLLRINWLLNY
jgi:hypothetical protein